MKVLRKFSRGNLKIDETVCPPSTPDNEGVIQQPPSMATAILTKSRRKSSTIALQVPPSVATVLTKTRRKSSTTAMHRGTMSILVLGDESIGKTTMCRMFTQQGTKDNETFCPRGVRGERRFSTPMILPTYPSVVGLSHYDVRISVVCTEWCRKNVRAYRDLLLSSDGFILAYRKSKRESFISLIEVASDIKRSRSQSNTPVIVASLTSENNETSSLRNDDLIVLQEETFEIDLKKMENAEQMFRNLVQKCVQSNWKS